MNIDATFEAMLNEFDSPSTSGTSLRAHKEVVANKVSKFNTVGSGILSSDMSTPAVDEEESANSYESSLGFTIDHEPNELKMAKPRKKPSSVFIAQDADGEIMPVKEIEKSTAKVNKVELMKSLVLPTMKPISKEEESQISAMDSILGSQEDTTSKTVIALTANITQGDTSFMESNGTCRFYWIDAFEKPNGQVLLIGKVYYKSNDLFVSCCVTVKNIQRNLFVLPRETVGDRGTDVVQISALYEELAALMTKTGIPKFACKKVSRKYAFEIANIPEEAEYLKVIYDYGLPQLPKAIEGETFSHIFGIGTSALETLLIKRKIMGPSWLELKNAKFIKKNISWCKIEAEIESPKDLSVLVEDLAVTMKTPNLNMLSLHVKTCYNRSQQINEIVMASLLCYPSTNSEGVTQGADGQKPSAVFHAIRPLDACPLPLKLSEAFESARCRNVTICPNERALLNFLLAQIQRLDPDVLVGHSIMGFDLPVLLYRMKQLKVERWSRLGRLHWSSWPKSSGSAVGKQMELNWGDKQILAGRLICDTYLSCKDLVKSKNYSLKELALSQLGMTKEDLDFERIPELASTKEGWIYLVKHCETDTFLASQLVFKLLILPLTKQLTNLAGNLWAHTMMGSRSERNEYLLLHEFYNNKYIVPDKSQGKYSFAGKKDEADEEDIDDVEEGKSRTSRRKPAYAGGLVLEPKVGFYDNYVILLDFNSLYPSIIQEFNICFTTVERSSSSVKSAEEEEEMPSLPEKNLGQGILPKLLGNLVARRRQVKKLLSDPKLSQDEIIQLDIRQKGLKLTANSMYGCLGFTKSRFYAKPLAMLITHQGRNILQATVDAATNMLNLEVIYGDTDSIMVHTGTTDLHEAKKMAFALKKLVNERYKLLEIELDGIFQKLLLLKKKKYAALIVTNESQLTVSMESKGLDLVRRDWCPLSNIVSSYILEKIMSNESRDAIIEAIHAYLENLGVKLRSDELHAYYPLAQFVITKSLTKNPADYVDAKNQPHVSVALAMKEKSGICPRAGDIIPYIICLSSDDTVSGISPNSKLVSQRAFHPDHVAKSPNLKVDVEWYLSQQIFPPVSRLCVPIEGTDATRIAQCLGLDSKRYFSTSLIDEDREDNLISTSMLLETSFKQASPLKIDCYQCKSNFSIDCAWKDNAISWICPSCKYEPSLGTVNFALIQACRQTMNLYYQQIMHCDDPNCPNPTTRRLSVYEKRCPNIGCRGSLKLALNERSCYLQLVYYKQIFDIVKAKEIIEKTIDIGDKDLALRSLEANRSNFLKLQHTAESFVQQCAYPIVSLQQVFSYMKAH